ncbi:MAG: hypothetical protein LUG96_15355 [Tannerellaceae bacterium]|nr:hypothetical protein [Tannerellaceae bacterium]
MVIIKTYTYPFKKMDEQQIVPVAATEVSDPVLQRFAGGIRIPTISNQVYEETNFAPFDSFKLYLPETYPAIYKVMDTLTINTYGLVFR